MNEKTNDMLTHLVGMLKNDKKAFWQKVARELNKPRKQKVEVNLNKLETFAGPQTIVVPGKILGAGSISKKCTVAAFAYSEHARAMIEKAGGKVLSIHEYYKADPLAKDAILIK